MALTIVTVGGDSYMAYDVAQTEIDRRDKRIAALEGEHDRLRAENDRLTNLVNSADTDNAKSNDAALKLLREALGTRDVHGVLEGIERLTKERDLRYQQALSYQEGFDRLSTALFDAFGHPNDHHAIEIVERLAKEVPELRAQLAAAQYISSEFISLRSAVHAAIDKEMGRG